jgi:hypothetical protein
MPNSRLPERWSGFPELATSPLRFAEFFTTLVNPQCALGRLRRACRRHGGGYEILGILRGNVVDRRRGKRARSASGSNGRQGPGSSDGGDNRNGCDEWRCLERRCRVNRTEGRGERRFCDQHSASDHNRFDRT